MAIPDKDRTPAQKQLAEGLALDAEGHVGGGRRGRRREPRPTTPSASGSKREIHAIERTLPRPPAHAHGPRRQGDDGPRDVRRSAGATPRTAARRSSPGRRASSWRRPRTPSRTSFPPTETTTGRRLALARWLTRPDNPLTARVIVNRLWQHHFGRGIVATPSDFGVRGEAPSHPELLDWLATELVAQGWRLKPIHRLMVTSATYRQASRHRREIAQSKRPTTPTTRLLWRMNRRRLDAEGLRDAMLVVSGELNPKAGGPGVLAPIEKEVEDLIFTEAEVVDLWPETPDPSEHVRRSLYLFRKRNVRYPMFDAFDAPDTQTACPQRTVSTHALQALVLLNSDFAVGAGQGPGGPALPRSDRRSTPSGSPRLPARPGRDPSSRRRSTRPGPSSPRRPTCSAQRRACAARPADVHPHRDRPGRGRRLGRFRPGDAQPERISSTSRDDGFPSKTRPRGEDPDHARPAVPARSRLCRPAVASSSSGRGTASACSGCRTLLQQTRPAAGGRRSMNPLAARPGHFPARRSAAFSCS